MPIRNGNYIKRTEEVVFETIKDELLDQNPDANPQADATMVHALIMALALTIAQEQEEDLQDVYEAAYVVDATGEELTKKAHNLGVIRQEATEATGVVVFSRSSAATSDYTIPSGTVVETLEEDPVAFETTEPTTIESGTTSAKANIEAVEGGADGNVGPNAIEVMPSKPTGVESVTNNDPTGDPSITDTNDDPLRVGYDREDDEELRKRVLETDSVSEGPSADGIELAIENVDGVVSKHVESNQTSSTVNGIDPYKTEVTVYGGDAYDIVETLSETMSVTSFLRLQGGVNGTLDTADVYIRLLDQTITGEITRPTLLTFDVNIDVVHTANYAGGTEVKDALVDYVGGTYVDDSTTTGTDLGDNVLVNELENRAEDVQGVDYADVTLVDTNDDGTDDTTTDSDGVPILSVADSEVARLDADDVTISTTAR
jgi:uncharacterized phage protein gp47/JayE